MLLIDNYDSFTYNLVQAFLSKGAEVLVHRNDMIDVDAAYALAPTHLVISPGPGRPEDAGQSLAMIGTFAGRIPVLGVCLGHQAIAVAFGGSVDLAPEPRHGKVSPITHDGRGVFRDLPNPFEATRYHSLATVELPDELQETAHSEDGVVQGIRHRTLPITGVQFHPESIMTTAGKDLLANFLDD